MDSFMLDLKTHRLLGLMSIIPDVFQDVFIFESDEVEDFDIGFCSFYLLTRKDIVVHGYEFFEDPYKFSERLREKHSISLEEPSIAGQEGCDVTFFETKMISKPRNLKGDLEEGLAIKPKIEKGLQKMKFMKRLRRKSKIPTGPDGMPMVYCQSCSTWITKSDYDNTWDWAGPHCPDCGDGGMEYFAQQHGPVQSGRFFSNKIKDFCDGK